MKGETCEGCPWYELREIWDSNGQKTELEVCRAEDSVIVGEYRPDWCPNKSERGE